MAGKLAVSFFESGPEENLAAPDIYNITTDSVVNSIQDVTNKITDGNALLSLQGGKAMLKKGMALAKVAVGVKAALSSKNALMRIAGVSVGLEGVSKLLSSGASGGAGGGLLDKALSGIKQASTLAVTAGGIIRNVKNGNYSDIIAMGGALDGLPGVTDTGVSCRDNRGTISTLSSMVSAASSIGIPNSISKVLQYEKLVNSPTRVNSTMGIFRQSLPDVVRFSDIGSLSTMASAFPPGTLKRISPDVASDVLRNYRLPAETKASQYGGYSQEIRTTLDRVDPRWKSTSRAGESDIVSLASLREASSDLRNVMRSGILTSSDPLRKLELLADIVPNLNITQRLAKSFPRLVMDSDKRPTSALLDPRIAPRNFDTEITASQQA